MPRLNSPLVSLGAQGSVGGTLTYQRIHHRNIVRSKPTPTDPQTFPQLAHRFIYWDIVQMWHDLTTSEKRQYEIDARRRKITAFNMFMSEELELATHLLAYFPLDEGSGAIARDFSPFHSHATIYGATWTDGVYGPALLLDGADDYLLIPPKTRFTGLSQFTIEYAFVLSSAIQSGYHYWMNFGADIYLYVSNWNQNDLISRLRTSDGYYLLNLPNVFPTAGVVYRLSIKWDGSLLSAVLNGSFIGQVAATGIMASFTPTTFYLGNRAAKDLALFGVLDDFRFYDKALTLVQQQRHTERSPR